jgi:hypothetical protein
MQPGEIFSERFDSYIYSMTFRMNELMVLAGTKILSL